MDAIPLPESAPQFCFRSVQHIYSDRGLFPPVVVVDEDDDG